MTISQESFKREKIRLGRALGRFNRTQAIMRTQPANPYSHEADTDAYKAALSDARDAAYNLLDVARSGFGVFDSEGYPDSWHRWEVAARDADHYLTRTDHLVEWEEVTPA